MPLRINLDLSATFWALMNFGSLENINIAAAATIPALKI
jgi:hypothetical protein